MDEIEHRRSADGLKIINASLFRMGTKSMAEAYKILGYNTHHALDNSLSLPWPLIERAAEAKWPHTPGARPTKSLTKADWDAIWGSYDAVTDLASPFAADLAQVYPEAKVVIVQRDFETWWPSFTSEILGWRFFTGAEFLNYILQVFHVRSGSALGKVYLGLFDARNVEEIHQKARITYERYFDAVREAVPSERRLEYKLGSGWQPLCDFLGKDIPDMPFPRVNDRGQHSAEAWATFREVFLGIAYKAAAWVVGAIAIAYMLRWSLGY